MAKVQSDFYFRWAQNRIQDTIDANAALDDKIEYVGVDTSLNTVQITLPDSSGSDVVNGKKIWIVDQGSAGTNAITVIPNASDGTTIAGEASFVINQDDAVVIFELVEEQWVVLANSEPNISRGGYYVNENITATIISRNRS